MRMPKVVRLGAAVVFTFAAGDVVRADLVPAGTVDLTGTGFGSVNTILTFQGTGQSMGQPESGCVGVSISGTLNTTGSSVCQGGNVGGAEKSPAGFPHNQTFQVSNASQIALVFNADQPGGGQITITNLTLSLFSSSGVVGFASGTFAPVTFNSTMTGVGKSGFLFVLDSSQAAAAQAAINGGFNLLGLSATATPALGGPETFFLTTAPGTTQTPEPSVLSVLTVSLLGLSWLRLRRRTT